jgi:hypothetical protein
MRIPAYLRDEPYITPSPQRDQRRRFLQWRHEQARKEYGRWVNRHPAAGSADGYKDDTYRRMTRQQYSVNQLRRNGNGDVIRQKKQELRTRWSLVPHRDIRPL